MQRTMDVVLGRAELPVIARMAAFAFAHRQHDRANGSEGRFGVVDEWFAMFDRFLWFSSDRIIPASP